MDFKEKQLIYIDNCQGTYANKLQGINRKSRDQLKQMIMSNEQDILDIVGDTSIDLDNLSREQNLRIQFYLIQHVQGATKHTIGSQSQFQYVDYPHIKRMSVLDKSIEYDENMDPNIAHNHGHDIVHNHDHSYNDTDNVHRPYINESYFKEINSQQLIQESMNGDCKSIKSNSLVFQPLENNQYQYQQQQQQQQFQQQYFNSQQKSEHEFLQQFQQKSPNFRQVESNRSEQNQDDFSSERNRNKFLFVQTNSYGTSSNRKQYKSRQYSVNTPVNKYSMMTVQSMYTNNKSMISSPDHNDNGSYQSDDEAITIKFDNNQRTQQLKQYQNKQTQVSREFNNNRNSYEQDSLNQRNLSIFKTSGNNKNEQTKYNSNIDFQYIINQDQQCNNSNSNNSNSNHQYQSNYDYYKFNSNSVNNNNSNNNNYQSNYSSNHSKSKISFQEYCKQKRQQDQLINNTQNIDLSSQFSYQNETMHSKLQKIENSKIEEQELKNEIRLIKTQQQQLLNFMIQNFNNFKHSLEMDELDKDQILEKENRKDLQRFINQIQQKPVFSDSILIQVQTYLRLYNYPDCNVEDLVQQMFSEQDLFVLNVQNFAEKLINQFTHLKELEDKYQNSIVNFVFETIDIKRDGLIDANELGLGFELIFKHHNQYYKAKKLDQKVLKLKQFFSSQLNSHSQIIFSQNMSLKVVNHLQKYFIQNIWFRLVEVLDYDNKEFVTYWDIISKQQMQECQQFIDLIDSRT